MASFGSLLAQCQAAPALSSLHFQTITSLIALFRHMKERISFTQKSPWKDAPQYLPNEVHLFIMVALDLDYNTVRDAWSTLKDIAWEPDIHTPSSPNLPALIPLYLEHGRFFRVAPFELFPPTRTCLHNYCPNSPLLRGERGRQAPDLGEPLRIRGTLFTQAYGPLPMYSTSTYCRGCNTRYHHNFCVRRGLRTYYTSASPIIPISMHFFIEAALCEQFANQTTMAWTSSQNCAKIYNETAYTYSWRVSLPQDWPYTFLLNYELVGEAFFIHALLNWHHDRLAVLEVPQKVGTQAERWHAAIEARNRALAGTGQPAWNHACNLCTKHVKDATGRIIGVYRSVVTDGVSLGHPCCAVHDCKESLPSNKHRYCATHANLSSQCAVSTCHADVEAGFRTCTTPAHRAAEQRYNERGTAMFQLKHRNAKAHDLPHDGSKPPKNKLPLPGMPGMSLDAVGDGDSDEEEEEEEEAEAEEAAAPCNDKPATGHRKVYARFGRRRTHNEQLCVASCGIILGRATFYGAEGPNSVRLFWKGLFPTKASNPAVHWFDDNCHMAAMFEASGDTYFDHVALPVDVFHFKSKHKESDEYCGRNCNPAQWAELMDETTGKWIFNSSAAEQVNLWFGGFRAMTRLMRGDRFNFLLDEVIMRRNRSRHVELEAAGHAPYAIPRQALLGIPAES